MPDTNYSPRLKHLRILLLLGPLLTGFLCWSLAQPPLEISGSRGPNGGIDITVSYKTNQPVELRASTNLLDWNALVTNQSETGIWIYNDAQTDESRKFYQAREYIAPDVDAPVWPTNTFASTQITSTNVMVTWTSASDAGGIDRYAVYIDGVLYTNLVSTASNFVYSEVTLLSNYTLRVEACDVAGNCTTNGPAFLAYIAAPEPGQNATTLDATVPGTFHDAFSFLYDGPQAVQFDVSPDAITPKRAAVARGQVLDRNGNPLPGVTVSLPGQPGAGFTQTRTNGWFDLALNGGARTTFNYEKAGYFSVQRQIRVPWQDVVALPTIVMIEQDSAMTMVDLTDTGTPLHVHTASAISDDDGDRTGRMMLRSGTTARMLLPDGSTQALNTASIRITEYTVGTNGPAAMPAALPPNSAYTYCAEFSLDEALASNATTVVFNQPLHFYLENFLDFPVGGLVPVGYYDRQTAQWVASSNGLIIAILSETNGFAVLDIDGSGTGATPAELSALAITTDEREQLATLYDPGDELWRVPVMHFSTYDCNWPYHPPADATPPNQPPPEVPQDEQMENPCEHCGSIIEVQNQALREQVGIPGTPYSINYDSDRMPGRRDTRQANIFITGASPPASLKRAELALNILGQEDTQTFANAPDQTYTFLWDGLDGYGRPRQGTFTGNVLLRYVYDGVYDAPDESTAASFAEYGNNNMIYRNDSRQEVIFEQNLDITLGSLSVSDEELGGWTLNVHHRYDFTGGVIHYGDGTSRNADEFFVITGVAGDGGTSHDNDGSDALSASIHYPRGLAFTPDGGFYVGGYVSSGGKLRYIDSSNIISTPVASSSTGINGPWDIDVGPDGTAYIANRAGGRVHRLDTNGVLTLFAGIGSNSFAGDGGPATNAAIAEPAGIAVGPDGSVYIADFNNERVRKVRTDGIIVTIAGNGSAGYTGDGGPATNAAIGRPWGLLATDEGSLYIADSNNDVIRKVSIDGIISTFAGTGTAGYSGDGGLATLAELNNPTGMDFDEAGNFYFADGANQVIRRISPDGIISTIAGTGASVDNNDDGVARSIGLRTPVDLEVGPDGAIYFCDSGNHTIRKISRNLGGIAETNVTLVAEDGRSLFEFDSSGRHLRTIDALTGSNRFVFTYTTYGDDQLLTGIEDEAGLVTLIERATNGTASAIVGPFGHRTVLTMGSDGYLAALDTPGSNRIAMTYFGGDDQGLIASITDANGYLKTYGYDEVGRLVAETNALAGVTTLSRTNLTDGYAVILTTPLGMEMTYAVTVSETGSIARTSSDCGCGGSTETIVLDDGSIQNTYPDGTVAIVRTSSDPRWGSLAPLIDNFSITTPAGLNWNMQQTRGVQLVDENDLLSVYRLTETNTFNGKSYIVTDQAYQDTRVISTPEGRVTTYQTDHQGYLTNLARDAFASVSLSYDAYRRITNITQDARMTAYAYATNGLLERIENAAGESLALSFDDALRLTNIVLADGSTVSVSHDANGNLANVAPPGRPAHSNRYNAANQLTRYTLPEVDGVAPTWQLDIDLDGKTTNTIFPDGIVHALTYDPASGKLTGIATPDQDWTIAYDAASGHLTSITRDDGAAISLDYDGLLTTAYAITGGIVTGTFNIAYNHDFKVATNDINGTYPVSYSYDDDTLLTTAGDLILNRSAVNGMVESIILSNVLTEISYNTFGEIEELYTSIDGTGVYRLVLGRDVSGRITSRSDVIATATNQFTYTFDALGQLTQAVANASTTRIYHYGANSTRSGFTGTNGTITATYDTQDKLLSAGDAAFGYSLRGELTSITNSAGLTTYHYDAFSRLTNAVLADGTTVSYALDALGRRAAVMVNGAYERGFIYQDTLRVAAEIDASGAVSSRFVYAFNTHVPDAMIRGSATYRLLKDHLGSVRLVVRVSDGMIMQQIDYDEFGRVTADSNPGFQPFGFAGGLYDHRTGLVRFGARDYDADTGRWTTRDPMQIAGGLNVYVYAYNNPVTLKDPTGMMPNLAPLLAEMVFGGRGPDYVALGGGASLGLGFDLSFALDRCGGLYFGYGVTGGTPGGSLYLNAGKLIDGEGQGNYGLADRLSGFLAGTFVSAGGGIGVGGGINQAVGFDAYNNPVLGETALELGLTTPGAAATAGEARQLLDITDDCIW